MDDITRLTNIHKALVDDILASEKHLATMKEQLENLPDQIERLEDRLVNMRENEREFVRKMQESIHPHG